MKLTSENVSTIFEMCLCGKNIDNPIVIEGIVAKYGFDKKQIENNKSDIEDMLSQLPKEFHKGTGGGWSFLGACHNKDGEQWTGMHRSMEQLFCLGIAIGKVEYLLPREMWNVLPGGMPYLVIN